MDIEQAAVVVQCAIDRDERIGRLPEQLVKASASLAIWTVNDLLILEPTPATPIVAGATVALSGAALFVKRQIRMNFP